MPSHGFPSEITGTHAFELQIDRSNKHGRPLTSLSVFKSNDRAEVEAEAAKRSAVWAESPSMAKRNRTRIVEHKNVRPPAP